ncbi:IS481 family transposase [Baekduia soli]|uniref:IS481 family transposase n=1 Tax=Baekduia soli TaxID=496014 RepID=A0A5B8UCH9_9ACTN|nr:IS481 family transposase [Baekduia soli]QEC50362.1 IS481 family transposase [Baekduia soli]
MKLHANARLSLIRRREMVEMVVSGQHSVPEAARIAGVSATTCSKWVRRFETDGELGLLDRSSAPNTVANRTDEQRIGCIAALRRLRMTGPEIAEVLGMALSTVSGILTKIGMGKLGRLGLEPARRYARERPGELIHVDVKKLGRIGPKGAGHRMTGSKRGQANRGRDGRRTAGWEFIHVAIDDATRLAYVESLADEKAITAIGFLKRAKAFFEAHGMSVQAVMTDNGSAYRSTAHAIACRALGLKHLRTRAYRPQTNGKAERFIRTMLSGWAYGALYRSSDERAAALDGWLFTYNHRRRHAAISRQTPITRLNNLLGTYT